jgi:hypothetical protein
MGLGFEWTVKFGDVLTVLSALFILAAFLHKRGGQEVGVQVTLEALTRELTEMKTEFKEFGDTLKKVAIQEVQINLLMKWYDELRHGEGFVQGVRGVDREYPRE